MLSARERASTKWTDEWPVRTMQGFPHVVEGLGDAERFLVDCSQMRVLPLFLLLSVLRVAASQTESAPPPASLFDSQVPQITVSVKKHPMGADLVEVTVTAAGYPPELLRSQIKALGKYLQCEPRGS